MTTKVKKSKIDRQTRDQLSGYLLEWLARNPGCRVPAGDIARIFKVEAHQVTHVLRYLIKMGRLDRVSKFTYRIPDTDQLPLPVDQPTVAAEDSIAMQVEALVKEYVYENKSIDPGVRGFVEWLKGKAA